MPAISDVEVKSLGQGEWLHRQHGDSSVAVWKDQKAMWLLYNHCSPSQLASLQRWNDAGARVSIGCPRAVHDYFFNARSVDIINQLHYSYLIGRKSRKCWWRLAWWLIDMCIVNALRLWSFENEGATHLHFREELMRSLVHLFGSDREAVQASRGANVSVALVKDHYLIYDEEERDCSVCSHRPNHRVRSHYKCNKCGVHLCVSSCFAKYHASA